MRPLDTPRSDGANSLTAVTTVAEALKLYKEERAKETRHLSNLISALKTCLLPGYGFSVVSRPSKQNLNDCLHQLQLFEFKNALGVFEKVGSSRVKAGEISISTLNSYKSDLRRFLEWLHSKPWYEAGSVDPRYAPKLYSGQRVSRERQASDKKPASPPLSLKESELTNLIREQIAALETFWTKPRHQSRSDKPLRRTSIETYKLKIYLFLGWIKNVYLPGIELEELNLELMTNLELVREFVNWGLYQKENSYAWASQVIKSALFVTKWWSSQDPQSTNNTSISTLVSAFESLGLKATPQFLDALGNLKQTTPKVDALRAYQRELQQQSKKQRLATSQIGAPKKLLTFEQCQQVVEYLKQCCAARRQGRQKRPDSTIRQSIQCYLIIKLLLYCPVRQREIRELELGRTLFREADRYIVFLEPDDHKTGSATGLGREFPLPDEFTPDLDEWLNGRRLEVETNHQFVFISQGSKGKKDSIGQPFSEKALCSMVKCVTRRATTVLFGKPMSLTPHDFRRIAITHHRQVGNLSHSEALATLMGHSVSEADKIYNQMTILQKAEKARNWWHEFNPKDL